MKKYSSFILLAFAIVAYLLPLYFSLNGIAKGIIPFWYDPARDMLLGLANLSKPTLIGPPTGIPNIFYGPYWIWLISLAITLNKDPRFVTFFVVTLPYYIILPFILYKLSSIIGRLGAILLWLLFIFAFGYSNQLWNPNLAPLLYFLLLYVLVSTPVTQKISSFVWVFAAGLTMGLLLNFHISFGIGVTVATTMLILLGFAFPLKLNKKWFREVLMRIPQVVVFFIGIGVVFTPFLLFEARHGFHQIQAAIYTFNQAVFHNSAVVGQIGLKKPEIIIRFFGRISDIFKLPIVASIPIYLFVISYLVDRRQAGELNKKLFSEKERKLLTIIGFQAAFVLYIYLSSKNPVWDYHFVCVEILILVPLVLIANKFKYLLQTLTAGTIIAVFYSSYLFINTISQPVTFSTYITKKQTTEAIYSSADGKQFNVYAYDPSIYTYDYDYLFGWLGKKYHFIPQINKIIYPDALVYFIIPKTKPAIEKDFIHYRTPDDKYTTIDSWYSPDGTHIVKRAPIQE